MANLPPIKVEPILNLKRDVPVTDIYGKKSVIPEGEALTPYNLGNKVILQDDETYVVNKNQYQNIQGQSVKAEAKPFAPELAQTQETVKGGPTEGDIDTFLADEAGQGMTREEAREALNDPYADTPGTKYENYTLPGGKNYREILLQAPSKETNPTKAMEITKKAFAEYDAGKITLEERNKLLDTTDQYTHDNDFKSSHWDEPNVLAHLRMNDRQTPEGKKVAFMEEMQSDWAREARAHPQVVGNISGAIQPGGVPSNPLLKNWQELAFKRALKEAVDTHSDYLAWANGEQQAARYNLSKQVDNISWKPQGQLKYIDIQPIGGNHIDMVTDHSGKIISAGEGSWTGKNVADVIGKGIGEKILTGGKQGVLSGEGLNIGGEWAKHLYDKQIPDIAHHVTGQKAQMLDLGLPTKDQTGSGRWWNVLDSQNAIELKPSHLKAGKQVSDGVNHYIVTDVLKDNKFKAIPLDMWEGRETDTYPTIKDIPDHSKQTYDISPSRSIGQPAIKITPEIQAMVQGQAPQLKQPSGVTPQILLNQAGSQINQGTPGIPGVASEPGIPGIPSR